MFLEFVLAPLAAGQPEIHRLISERLDASQTSSDDLYSMIDPLQDTPDDFAGEWWLDPGRCRFWLCLFMDWKADEEVEWQVQAIARTLGLNSDFTNSTYGQTDVPTSTVLWEAAAWMRERGYEMVFLEVDGDNHLAVPVRDDLLAKARTLDLPAFLFSPSGSTSRLPR